jgi:hypothetical protein
MHAIPHFGIGVALMMIDHGGAVVIRAGAASKKFQRSEWRDHRAAFFPLLLAGLYSRFSPRDCDV